MRGSEGLDHIVRQDDGSHVGLWGPYVLKSAFQPILTLSAGRAEIVAHEGLARPFRDNEAVGPAVFFGALPEEHRFAAETLTRKLHLLNAAALFNPAMSIFVNVDPTLCHEPQLAARSAAALRDLSSETGIEPGRIVCEVTEQPSQSETLLKRFVETLRYAGFRIAVDDYGAAESGIKRIDALQPDIVKFDARWIYRLMSTEAGFDMLAAMTSEFAGRAIVTVFEGIEEPWQVALAARAGASMVQGFALGRPRMADDCHRAGTAAEKSERMGVRQ